MHLQSIPLSPPPAWRSLCSSEPPNWWKISPSRVLETSQRRITMPLPEGANIDPLTLEPVWLVNAFRLTREVSYGASALLLWDMCLTFADEVGTPGLRFVLYFVAKNQPTLLPYRLTQYGPQGGALQTSYFSSIVMSHRP